MFVLRGRASDRDIPFEVLEKGDVSGFVEEAYFVVKDEIDWVRFWERHTSVREPRPPPLIDFSRSVVVCAFMGQCPTTGYSISIERIWTDGEYVFVEVFKRCPPKDLAVCQMVTYPYVIVLMDKADMHFVFRVVDENGETAEYMLSEYPLAPILIVFLALVCGVGVSLKTRKIPLP
ncbi:MAG: protease complex subunit PrcB family protein [Candidatus Bathyarchaeota archaeon]|nr:protease complex subunit PrcB family protein [Candidatus Bathyarchaeota archaeon]MDW8040034.1 protease complex subunit PrcB family protein [Nitrososphaerota archaeon]